MCGLKVVTGGRNLYMYFMDQLDALPEASIVEISCRLEVLNLKNFG